MPGVQEIKYTGITFDNVGHTMNIALDMSAGRSTVTYGDNTTGPIPSTFNIYYGTNANLNPYLNSGSTVYCLGVFDDDTGSDGIEYGWLMPPKCGSAIVTV
jgi:hypothetical protein